MAKNENEDAPRASPFGSVVLVAGALSLLVALYVAARNWRAEADEAPELPLASIMIEVDQFDAATRARVVQLENALKATGVFGSPLGPADAKLLLPGEKPGDAPVAKAFGDLTDEEWAKAWPYVAKTDFYIPRMFRLDGTACVIRCDAKKGEREFAPDTAAKLTAACELFKASFKTFRVYSRALRVGTPLERDALNASFGCQLAWVVVSQPAAGSEKPLGWRSAAALATLNRAKGVLTDKHFRSVTTAANLVRYYWTVSLQAEKAVDLPNSDEDVQKALAFAKANGIHPYISQDGFDAIIDTTTDAEGQANAELYWFMGANLEDQLRVQVKGYQPKIKRALKGEITPATPR